MYGQPRADSDAFQHQPVRTHLGIVLLRGSGGEAGPEAAIAAAAWHLHDLAAQLPQSTTESYTRDELLALGYNAGASSMLAIANGTTPTEQAQSYVDRLRTNWAKADEAVRTG